MLLPLTLGAADVDATPPEGDPRPVPDLCDPCGFCGQRSAGWQFAAQGTSAPVVACALCHLSLRLDRPHIDEEAVLVWLPEVSQAALNVLVRAVHLDRHLRDDALPHGEPPRARRHGLLPDPLQVASWHACAALAARAEASVGRLGTDRPSELAAALHLLSPAARSRQADLLDGLRLFPLGRFFLDGADVYPDVVASWRLPTAGGFSGQKGTTPASSAPLVHSRSAVRET